MQQEKQLKSYYKNNLSSPNTHHSSSRSVSMRDIVAGVPNASLYPGFARAASTGMTSEASVGFTLIELLVVVLIIGILAAVAMPQYQFAVDKARVMSYVQHIKQLIKAQQLAKMATGEYAPDLTTLDIDLTKICTTNGGSCHNELYNCPGGFGINLNAGGLPCHTIANDDGEYFIIFSYCPNRTECSSSDAPSRIFSVGFNLDDGSIDYCGPSSARGQKICNWLTQQFR